VWQSKVENPQLAGDLLTWWNLVVLKQMYNNSGPSIGMTETTQPTSLMIIKVDFPRRPNETFATFSPLLQTLLPL
jgi:hypothetical protein